MGAFKPLLPIGDANASGETTVIERMLKTCSDAGICEVAVVTGHNREALQPYIRAYGAVEAFNDRFEEGMFTSMQKGIAAMSGELDGFFMMPVDCPLVTVDILKTLVDSFDTDRFSVPCYRGKKGHPLLIPAKFRDEILAHDGKNGLKAITDRDFDLMQRIETGYEGVVMDMDTPEAYEEIKSYAAAGCLSEDIRTLARGRRFILIRHGQIRQHSEKIFLGQTDVPLSDKGRQQAEYAAKSLAGLNVETERIYSSDLKRASESAQIIKDMNGIKELILESGFREMNLGPWDGMFISEVKRTMPDEYEKRGKNIMTYKMGHGSENFFDLQYRVIKTLAGILKEDRSRDIIIAAHSGVLRGIENNLAGGDISDPWEKMNNGEVRIIEV